MMLKIQILYLKLQTKDHYWSPTLSEVMFLVFLYHRNKNTFYCDLATVERIQPALRILFFFLAEFCFAVFF